MAKKADLVGILKENVAAVRLAHDEVYNGADDAPAVGQVDVHLG